MIVAIFLTPILAFSQQVRTEVKKIQFSPFEGMVYKIPAKKTKNASKIQEHYGENVLGYDTLQSISLRKINISDRYIKEEGFPGIERTTKFAMILHSEATVKELGCYEFTLKSDDGSILWLDDEVVVNNDGGHAMRTKRDSIILHPTTYNAKLWYFQGLPTRLGFIFEYQYLGDTSLCLKGRKLNDTTIKPEKIVLDAVHFETAQADLTTEGITAIQKIGKLLKSKEPKVITIIGHTDDRGSNAFNERLSQARSMTVMRTLKDIINRTSTRFRMIGRGYREPIDTSLTEEGRAKNRRVEITYE